MKISRRSALGALAGAFPAAHLRRAAAQEAAPAIEKGPFQGTRESLQAYRVPEWFRDAKFGIWAHWGPQSATEAGDWYARNMYMQGSAQYKYHLEHYGHPSKVGFKDVVPTFKADQWEPEHLMDLYQEGRRQILRQHGRAPRQLRHVELEVSAALERRQIRPEERHRRNLERGRPQARAPLRRERAPLQQLRLVRHSRTAATRPASTRAFPTTAPTPLSPTSITATKTCPRILRRPRRPWAASRRTPGRPQYFNRIKDLVDQHQPDLLYTDGGIPFETYGLSLVAHHYNVSAKRHHGRVEAVYTSKRREDCATGTCALDLERGIVDKIWPDPWQTDTCIGNWHYKNGIKYKTPKTVVDMLVDIVSRNGNLLLNFPLPGSGSSTPTRCRCSPRFTGWMAVNSEGIYATRPWKIYGAGPSTMPRPERQGRRASTRTAAKTSPPRTSASPPRARRCTPSSWAGRRRKP